MKAFIIAESDRTFSGKKKDFHAQEIIVKLGIPREQVKLVRYSFPQELLLELKATGNRWPLERYARNSLSRGIMRLPNDAIVMLSDADELPTVSQILVGAERDYVSRLYTPAYYGKGNWKKNGRDKWLTVKIGPKPLFTDLNQMRYAITPSIYSNPGAHFSTLFTDFADIYDKMLSSAHAEFDLPPKLTKRIFDFAKTYKMENAGRFLRSGMGLVTVQNQKDFSEPQRVLYSVAPEFFEFTPTERFSNRVAASYIVSNAWISKNPDFSTDISFKTICKAYLHSIQSLIVRNLKRVQRRLSRLGRLRFGL
jgi:hypothetical protein